MFHDVGSSQHDAPSAHSDRDPTSVPQVAETGRAVRLLCIGGEDHDLRLPFLRRLKAQGFEIHAAASCRPAKFEAEGMAFHPFAFARSLDPRGDRRAVATLRAIIETIRPDVVQSFDTKPNLYLALMGRSLPGGARMVRTINGTGRVNSSGSLASRCLRPIYNHIQRKAARVRAATVFQNEADMALFTRKRMACPDTARLIKGSGIDVETFDRNRRMSGHSALREQLGLTGSRLVMTVTRIEPLKGIRTLLAAAEIVHRVDPETQFVLVGPWENAGPGDSDLRDLCRRSPAIRWIGPRSDVQDLLVLADIFVLPTEFREGLPRVLLEAALAGLPIVTTDMPGCMSVVQHGENGLLVPPRAPGALSAAILELLADPDRRRMMGLCGAERIRRDFSLAGVTDQYAALYRELALAA